MAVLMPITRERVAQHMSTRNRVSAAFFARESERLPAVCRLMAQRFERGGRLLAFGCGHAASDAQHIAVEFLHPVLVGKRALPALDVSAGYDRLLPALVRAEDIVVGLGPPSGDGQVSAALRAAMDRGAFGLGLPGPDGDYAVDAPSSDPFVHQELIEVLYHTLWETLHLFLERSPLADGGGAASFLYPFLGAEADSSNALLPEAAASIRAKAACVERLREAVADDEWCSIAAAVAAIGDAVDRGGTVLCFGNGGSATDAADFAYDLCASPKGYARVPAISLSSDAATLTALANDIGSEALFSRQLNACARRGDVAVAFSTSGGSSNITAALDAARSQGVLTIALVGYGGGEVLRRRLADHVIVVNSDQIPRVQEVQASISHLMLDLLDASRRAGG